MKSQKLTLISTVIVFSMAMFIAYSCRMVYIRGKIQNYQVDVYKQ